MQLLLGVPVLQMIAAGVELRLFDRIGEARINAGDLADSVGASHDATYRLLRGLSAVGLVIEHEARAFSLSSMGNLLRSNVPGSFDALARLNGSAWLGDAYREIAHSVVTGESGFTKHHGQPLFQWLSQHSEESSLFGRAMSTFSGAEVELVAGQFDFSQCEHIIDVGGGHGLLLSRLLELVPEAKGTLFDTPQTIGQAEGGLLEHVKARCERTAGDFFQSVPAGGDLYLLKHVLHDWDDDKALRIVGNVAAAMPHGAQLLVIEQGIAPPGIPNAGKVLDVIMLALLDGGRERTVDEHASLMERAGLMFEREIATPGPVTLFVARK